MTKAALAVEKTGHDIAPENKRGPGRGSRDRRLTANLHLYWYSLKVDREPPAFVKFDPTSILALWSTCLLAGAFSTLEAVSLEGRCRHQNGTEMLYRAIGLPFLDVRGRLTYVVCAIGGKAV